MVADGPHHEAFALQSAVLLKALGCRGGASGSAEGRQLAAKRLEIITEVAHLEQTVPGFLPRAIARRFRQTLIESTLDDQSFFLALHVSRTRLSSFDLGI